MSTPVDLSFGLKKLIRAILFDLDGTLLDRHSSLIIYVYHQMERCQSILHNVSLPEYLSKVIELDAHGHRAKDIVFQEVETYFGLPKESWRTLLNDFLKYFPDTCVPFPKMHQTLQYLHRQGILLGLVTNGHNASQNPKIDGLGIRPYFTTILISEAEGVKKPDPKIFNRALQQLNVTPDETVFVGDNPDADIHAAKFVGMKTVWMQDPYWPPPREADGVISQLSGLVGVIEKLNKD